MKRWTRASGRAPAPLPSSAATPVTIKAATDIPARLIGGNAQSVEVRGLDYTLHLDLEKLPTSEAPEVNDGSWTVVWDEVENVYKRVELLRSRWVSWPSWASRGAGTGRPPWVGWRHHRQRLRHQARR